ncbi:MAG: phosphoribosyltransferase family protein [Patescibacteria group bacterium]
MSKKEVAKKLRAIKVISNKPVKLRSGLQSSFYCDIKKVYGYPRILSELVKEISKLIPKDITCIAASGYGGLPLAVATSSALNLKFTAVRDKAKKHGRGGFIDGYVPNKSDKVLIVDDVLTTGSSIKETYSILRKTKAKIICAVVVVKRGNVKLPIPYKYVFAIEDLIKNI